MKSWSRTFFSCAVQHRATGLWLVPSFASRHVRIDRETLEQTEKPGKLQLQPKLGDFLILCGRDAAETVGATVVEREVVWPAGIRVEVVGTGAIGLATKTVQVVAAGGAVRQQAKRRAA